ncbi:MAG: cytochrome c [Myxococcales bacterium]|nr:cytochrome c [Myxococcales bacterium]
MVESSSRKRWLVGGLLLVSAAAWASPWDIDMVDAVMFKAYEWEMKPQPADVVAREALGAPLPRDAGYYQNASIATVSRTDMPTVDALTDPYAKAANHTTRGQKLFRINCAPCHGLEGKGDGPVTKNDVATGVRRFMMPAPMLSGASSRTAKLSDGFLYSYIRNGGNGSLGATAERPAGLVAIGAGMPSYGALLTDAERWSVVAYMRTLPAAAYVPPAPPSAPDTPQ